MSNDDSPAARVIIVNYNGGDWLQRAVHALLQQDVTDFEAVVVDNASSDGSLDRLPADPRLRLMRLSANLGFAAANNLGAQGHCGPYLVTLNPDAIPAADWLRQLISAAEAHPQAAAFGSTQLSAADPGRYDGNGDQLSIWGCAWRGDLGRPVRQPHPSGEVFAPCAAAALYRREPFEQLGGFDASLFCYLEDVELALRLQLAGHRCRQVGTAVVLHAGSALTGSRFSLHHIYRNQLWLLIRHWPWPLLLIALPGQLLWLLAVALRQAPRGRAGWVLGGFAAGLAGLPAQWRRRRPAPSRQLARLLSWNPLDLLRRRSLVARNAAHRQA